MSTLITAIKVSNPLQGLVCNKLTLYTDAWILTCTVLLYWWSVCLVVKSRVFYIHRDIREYMEMIETIGQNTLQLPEGSFITSKACSYRVLSLLSYTLHHKSTLFLPTIEVFLNCLVIKNLDVSNINWTKSIHHMYLHSLYCTCSHNEV